MRRKAGEEPGNEASLTYSTGTLTAVVVSPIIVYLYCTCLVLNVRE